jgi:hypothetical protein
LFDCGTFGHNGEDLPLVDSCKPALEGDALAGGGAAVPGDDHHVVDDDPVGAGDVSGVGDQVDVGCLNDHLDCHSSSLDED